jgi:hypothetical protein
MWRTVLFMIFIIVLVIFVAEVGLVLMGVE